MPEYVKQIKTLGISFDLTGIFDGLNIKEVIEMLDMWSNAYGHDGKFSHNSLMWPDRYETDQEYNERIVSDLNEEN